MPDEKFSEIKILHGSRSDLSHGMEPDSWSRRIWETTIMISTFLSLLASSFLASFDSTDVLLIVILYACDLLYLVDTSIRIYQIAFAKKKEHGKNNTRKVSKISLFLDLVSLFPFELLAFAEKTSHSWLHRTRLHRLNRIARFHRIFSFFARCEDRLGTNIQLLRTLKHTFVAYGVIHLMACGWFVLSCDNHGTRNATCFADSWAAGGKVHKSKLPNGDIRFFSTLEKYLTCLYWTTITATSTGYGDIHAVNTNEKWYSVLCMIIGVLYFFGSILGDMGSSMTNSDQKRACFKHKLVAISDYLEHRKVSRDIGKSVQGYYEHMWIQNQGISGTGMFNELPMTFQTELSLNVNRHVLEKAPLFKDTCVGFKRMLSMSIKSTTYSPGQIVFKENDIGHTLYYIRRGAVEILSGKDQKPITVFGDGTFFGEISLVWNVPRLATARATCYSDILTLNRPDLNKVIKHYPHEYDTLRSTIEERYQNAEKNRSKKIILDVKDGEHSNQKNSKKTKFNRIDLQKIFLHRIFVPESYFIDKWRCVIFTLTVIFITLHSSIASFEVSFNRLGYGDNAALKCIFGLWYVYDLLLVLDIFVGLRTAVNHGKRGLVKAPKEIVKLRLKSVSFWMDILSVLPIEVFAFCFPIHKRWFAATFLKSNRIIRIYHIPQFFRRLESNISNNIAKSRAVMLALYIFLTTHLTGCVMYLQACVGESCSNPSWAHLANLNKDSHVVHHYIISVYWACATMTSTGYGDISAVSFRDEIVVLFVLVIGLLLYGYCLSNIAATLNNAVAPKTIFMEHVAVVLDFMKDNNLSDDLGKEVENYLKVVWRIHRGQSLPGARTLMDDMPISLQRDVAYDEMKQILQDVPIFKDTDEKFLRMVSLITRTFLFTPGDTVVHVGDMSRELYIVRRGQAEILSADKSCVVATFGPGGYFGEVGLLYGESRPSDVRAKTYCEIVMVAKADLDKVLYHFPVIAKQLVNIKDNIAVLRRLKSTALEEAQRSYKQQEMLNSKKMNMPKCSKETSKSWKLGKINPLYTEGARKISLPNRLTGPSNDKGSTPEFRHRRILILQRHEHKEYFQQMNPILRYLSMLLMRRTISPDSSFFRAWIFITSTVAYIYLILVGFAMSFLHAEEGIAIVESFFDVFFLIDIYIKLHVCFFNDKGIIVSHPVETAKNYLRTNFLLDLLAVLPLNLMVDHETSEISYFGKVNRILHLVKVVQFFSFFQMEVGRHANTIRHIALNSYMVLLMHYFACAWFLVACPEFFSHHHSAEEDNNATIVDAGIANASIDFHHVHFKCGPTSWVHKSNEFRIYHEPYSSQYIVCLYWAISTMCSVGYGDIHAYLSHERVLASICMVFGVVYFGYILAAAFASHSNADAQRSVYLERLEGIERFLMDQDISPSLEQRVLNHYEYVWQRTRGVDMKNLFEGLPISIQGKICLSLYQSYISSVPLFDGLESGFIKMLSLIMKPLYILKNEYIVRKGDIAQEIFFIHRGTVEVVSEDDVPKVLSTMTVGAFFGEISVVCGLTVDASIRALTNTSLLIISKEDLDNLLNDFPQFNRKIFKKAGKQHRPIEEEDEGLNEDSSHDIVNMQEKSMTPDLSSSSIVEEYINNENQEPVQSCENGVGVVISAPQCPRTAVSCLSAVYHSLTDWNRFVIKQNSPLRRIRQLNCIAIFMTYLTITYMAAYQDHSVPLIIFNYICEASFFVEIYLNFHMAYFSEDEKPVHEFDQVFMHYFSGKFRFDVVANFPLEIFALAFPSGLSLTAFSYLRLIHLVRIVRVIQLYNEWVTELNINVLLVTFSENLVNVALFIHSFACVWYMVACPSTCSKSSWFADVNEGTTKPAFSRYADSVYWAVATMTSTGYGDIHASNLTEMICASVVMISGKVIFGLVVGKITSALANIEAHRVEFEDKLTVVQAHMRGQNISPALQKRVVDFFRYNWAKNRGLRVTSLLDDMPYCLHAEICYTLIGDIISAIPMFRSCGMPFRRLLCTKAQFCHFYPGEFVMNDGDIGQGMYIVRRGKVESLSAESKEPLKFYSDGDFFGEENIILSRPCAETVRTVTHADLFLLTKSDIESILQAFRAEAIVVGQNSRLLRRLSIIKEES